MTNHYEKPEFGHAKMTAYNLLISQKRPCLGMCAKNIKIPGKTFVFDSIQEYSSVSGISMEELTVGGKISLGCHVNISDKIYLLLHNEDIASPQFENWTNLHEIGHICLGHKENGDKEEIEAHFFAASFSMPDAIIKHFISMGCTVNKQFLMEHFNVSSTAADKKINTMRYGLFDTVLDRKIVSLMHNDIDYVTRQLSRSHNHFFNFTSFNL